MFSFLRSFCIQAKRSSTHGNSDSRLGSYRNGQGKVTKSHTLREELSVFALSSEPTELNSNPVSTLSKRRGSKGKPEPSLSHNKEAEFESIPFQAIDPPKLFDTRTDHEENKSESKEAPIPARMPSNSVSKHNLDPKHRTPSSVSNSSKSNSQSNTLSKRHLLR